MTITNTLVISFLIATIIFNVWNAIDLRSLRKSTLSNDQLKDSKYWELKYKIQFLVSAFSAIVIIAAFLGYNTIDNIRDSVSKEINQKLDSTKKAVVSLGEQQEEIHRKVDSTGFKILQYQNVILGLSGKQATVRESIKLSTHDLDNLKEKITEINNKNILQQNIYIVEKELDTTIFTGDQIKVINFSDLITINGDKIPPLKSPPFILPVSNQGADFHILNVTNTSCKLQLWGYGEEIKRFRVTYPTV